MKTFKDIDEIKSAARVLHSHWFDKDTMKFFKSRVGNTVYKGVYFISSEQFDYNSPRLYSIRKVVCENNRFDIQTIGDFQGYNTFSEAVYHIKNYLH